MSFTLTAGSNPCLSRRQVLASGLAALTTAGLPRASWSESTALLTRAIPHSGEKLPVIGLGTPLILDFADDPTKQTQMTQVIAALIAGGGRMIDTANGYGKGEARLGEIVATLQARDRLFIASKYSSLDTPEAQRASIRNSQNLLHGRLDLFYAWGVKDPNFDMSLLRELKASGVTRYIGITSGRAPDLAALEQVITREKPDFLHFGYSIAERDAEQRLFPAARAAGTAVVGTVPFGGNSLFSKVGGRPVPPWASEFGATTWAQFFLKFVLSNPAIVAVVPGTNKVANLNDNLTAGRGPLPTASQRQRMIDYWATVV
jgi:aryl-alcohol dehydrogenase-like predicted oxidoreductase